MQPPHQHSRINLSELKAQIVKKLGPEGSKQYFHYLSRLLSLKISKAEFNKLCLRILGRENIPLHNQFIHSILRNACSAKVPPPINEGGIVKPVVAVGSKQPLDDAYDQNGFHVSSNQASGQPGLSNGAVLPLSPRKARTGYRDRRAGDRRQIPSLSDRPSDLRAFTFSELKAATKNFNRTTKIGEGGFGCVYKATVKTGEDSSKKIDVAIKQLGRRGLQGHKEWVTEVNVLGVAEHKNLVKLVGYCAEDDERGIQRLLVYEYMPNRSVENHLSARSETPLSWAMRLKIAQDAARGLAYLHEEMDVQIIFRDFKSSNILLDEQWNAKLSDFGLARLGPPEGLTHVSTAVVGTMGYAAPEYVQTGRLTSKSDVWSYGVFLYELITGRRPLDRNRPRSEQKLLEWVKPYISDSKKFQQIIDPRLDGKISRSAQKLSIVANRCLVRHAKTRPKMSEVLEMVNKVVETSTGIGNPGPPVRIAEPTSPESTRKGKRKVDTKLGDGSRLVRIWSTKLTNTC